MSSVTGILDRVQAGDPKAAGELLPLVYEELRKLGANPARVVDSQRLQQLFFGEIRAPAEDVAHQAFKDSFTPIPIALASLEPGIAGGASGIPSRGRTGSAAHTRAQFMENSEAK